MDWPIRLQVDSADTEDEIPICSGRWSETTSRTRKVPESPEQVEFRNWKETSSRLQGNVIFF